MGGTSHNKTRYEAFISYAHADEAMAARLHKALETYAVPRHLRAQGKVTKPVFRDVAELTAAHSLSENIQEAVRGSRVLIVLCSPAAKVSHWVNEEIRLFRKIHGDAAILSAIIEGTPETAFPQGLIEGGREPLAAALGTDKAGFKLGVTQLAAGVLGTGLDDLVQRESKRRNRLMGTGLAASIALSGVLGFTTLQAVEARNEAQLERTESEALLDFMVKDLKVKLEPVGRLELLEDVGRKAIEYYDKKDIADLSDDNLRLLAAARQVIAQVALNAGRMADAHREIETSAALTREVLERNPHDTDAIFAHAQSEFWVGEYFFKQGKLLETEKRYREYDRLAQILYQKDPKNFEWVMEAAWGQNNLGSWARDLQSQELVPMASENYTLAISYFEEAIAVKPNSKLAKTELANAMRGKAKMLLAFESVAAAREYTLDYIEFLKNLSAEYPKDVILLRDLYDSEIDYYHDHFLGLDEGEKTTLLEALDELFRLVQYDTQNLTYINYFLRAIANTSECFDLPELITRKDQIENILKILPQESGLNHKYYSSMARVIGIKINNLKGEKVVAKEQLRQLREIYSGIDDYSPQDWKLLYSVFLRHQELGDKEHSKKFAKLFLNEVNLRSDLEYPTILFSKLKANLALENCDSVKLLAQTLEARGYLKQENLKLSPCKVF